GFMYRHEPLIARTLELLRAGVVGPLRHVSAGFTYQQSRSPDVRLDPALGGGSLWDVGCYAVNAVRLVAGREPVEACGFAASRPEGVDDSFTGVLRFGDGIDAVIHSSFRAAYRTWLEVAGADGVLRVSRPFQPSGVDTIDIDRGGALERIEVRGSPLLFVRLVEDFVGAVLD